MSKATYDVTDLSIDNGAGDFNEFKKLVTRIVSNITTQQQMVHKAAVLATVEWFKNANPNWIGTLIQSLNPLGGSFRVQALILWFELFNGVKITIEKDGKVGVSKDAKWKGKRDADKLSEAKASPYYKIAPPEKPIKMPEVSFTAVGAMLNRREFLGEAPDWDAMLEEMKKAYESAKSSKGFKEWRERAAVAISEGELEYINAPVIETKLSDSPVVSQAA